LPFGPFCASIWTSGRREQHRLRAVCTYSLGLRHSRCFAFYTPCRVPPARTYFFFSAALGHCLAVSLISFVTSILIRIFHGPVEKIQPSLQRQQSQNITKANKLRSTHLHTHHQIDILSYPQLVFLHSSTPSPPDWLHYIRLKILRHWLHLAQLKGLFFAPPTGSCSIRVCTYQYVFCSFQAGVDGRSLRMRLEGVPIGPSS